MGKHPRSKPQSMRQPVKGAAKIASTSIIKLSVRLPNAKIMAHFEDITSSGFLEDLSHVNCAKATASALLRQEETNIPPEHFSLAMKSRDNGKECGKRNGSLPWNWYGAGWGHFTCGPYPSCSTARLQPQEYRVPLQRGERPSSNTSQDVLAPPAAAIAL